MTALPIVQDAADAPSSNAPLARPAWLRVKAPGSGRTGELLRLLNEHRLHTVCSSAACPNLGECWAAGTATFMILGNECTRACRFCDVKTSKTPLPVDLLEPERLADAVVLMGLSHVVITSVARDDLHDGGARQFARCIEAVRARVPTAHVEVLVPDFNGDEASLRTVLDANPRVFNHNVETSARLTPKIRSGADYARSFALLARAKALRPDILTKTGMMLGLGETDAEIADVLRDAHAAHVDIVTLGQYLRPQAWNAPVERYVTPEAFAEWKAHARALGIPHVEAGPLVRSSYHAERAPQALAAQP